MRSRFGPAGRLYLVWMALLLSFQIAEPGTAAAADRVPTKNIALIAGKKSHGPEGNGIHDYGWSVKLLKVMLDNSNVRERVRVEYHLDGWPADARTLDDADAIMVISDGRDGPLYEEAPHFKTQAQAEAVARQVKRGCGFLTFHFSTFAPDARAAEILDWSGGYFDWETNGRRDWYSAITVKDAEVLPAAKDHPVLRGVKPFRMKEEFYYNIRFADGEQVTPLWQVPALEGRADRGNVVAWARERADGGRGFGTTCGHFYDNWKEANFRRLILNALVWAAKAEVPASGVDAPFFTHAEITAALAGVNGTRRATVEAKPIRVLLFAGNEAHKWHNWEKTTAAIQKALARDARIRVDVSHDFEDLSRRDLADYDVILQNNYANWKDPRALSDASRTAFVNFLQAGGGLILIHFADGAYHFSLPDAGASDWPEYRNIARRVWNHQGDETTRSGHDAFGRFTVEVTSIDHPITRGLKAFRIEDELYYRQHGEAPIEPLLGARSKVTGNEEPLAWTYNYGKGRIFQTLLGHSERTYAPFETREILRRAVAWCAGRTVRELAPSDDPDEVAVAAPVPIAPAQREKSPLPPGAVVPPPGLHCAPADNRLRAVLLDRSENDVYMAAKADAQGALFVGGREAVFVFDPDGNGGYLPRQELLTFPQDSIIIGIEFRGDDLYVLANSALYLVPNGRVARTGLAPARLLWGLPLDLHVSFHCLAWGPEGDLYLTHGDPLLNYGDFTRPDHWGHWTLFAGKDAIEVPYTGQGAVLKMHPDGTQVRVVSTGFRGPVGLAFDDRFNLFTNGNDHESLADLYAPARLVHAAPYADFAWPRGWIASKNPERSDLLEPMSAELGRGVPCDVTYLDDPAFPAELRNSLLMCRWDRFSVTRYPLRRRGSSFATEEKPFLIADNNARPVGIFADGQGRIFVTMLYLAGNVASPYCYSDLVMIDARGGPTSASTAQRPLDLATTADEVLWTELGAPTFARRMRTHVEILRRGGALLNEAPSRLEGARSDDPSYRHLIWLAAAAGAPEAVGRLAELTGHADAAVRLQAVRALSEFPSLQVPDALFVRALDDVDPHVQLAALTAFIHTSRALPFRRVADLAGNDDSYLRQIAAKLLARRGTIQQLDDLARSSRDAARLAGVLAAGFRLTMPPTDYVPPETLPLHYPAENAFFKLKLPFADASEPVDLRTLGRIGSFTAAEWWKAHVPTEDERALVQVLMRGLDDPSERIVSQSIYFLSLIRDPVTEPLIHRAQLRQIDRSLAAAKPIAADALWTIGPFTEATGDRNAPRPLETGAVDLAASYPDGNVQRGWQTVRTTNSRFALAADIDPGKTASFYAHLRIQSGSRQNAVLEIDAPNGAHAWSNGQPLADRLDAHAGSRTTRLLLDLQPGSNDVLVRASIAHAPAELALAVRAQQAVKLTLPDKLDASLLVERLRAANQAGTSAAVPAEFASIDWTRETKQGNADQGRRLFGSLGCVKCHAIVASQKSGGGPSLTDARKRFTVPHVVESVLLPSRQIADAFRATTLVLDDGTIATGLVVAETGAQLELLLPDATRRTIPLGRIEERKFADISPMPMGIVKTPAELRDLVAYLLSENPQPP